MRCTGSCLGVNKVCSLFSWCYLSSVRWLCSWLGVRKTIRPVKMSDEVLEWLSIRSEMQIICIWSSWCYCHPIISCLIQIQIGVPLLYRLTQTVLKKRLLNGCLSILHLSVMEVRTVGVAGCSDVAEVRFVSTKLWEQARSLPWFRTSCFFPSITVRFSTVWNCGGLSIASRSDWLPELICITIHHYCCYWCYVCHREQQKQAEMQWLANYQL